MPLPIETPAKPQFEDRRNEPLPKSIEGLDDAGYLTDLAYATKEWGVTPEEWRQVCTSLNNVGVGPGARKAYVADLMSIIEAGFSAYFSELGNQPSADAVKNEELKRNPKLKEERPYP